MQEHFNSNRKQAALFALAITPFCGSLQLQIERYRDNSTISANKSVNAAETNPAGGRSMTYRGGEKPGIFPNETCLYIPVPQF
jgi:hypothetical protein